MKNNFKFLIVLAILLAGCICVGSTFAADLSVSDISDVSSVDNTQNIEIAHDDSSQKDVEVTELKDGETANFTQLQQDVSDAISGGTGALSLDKDYKYVVGDSVITDYGITIGSPLTIDGNGHTIDGSSLAKVFRVTNSNVVLKNIVFINTYAESNGGAINWQSANAKIENCTFINCSSSESMGGAIYLIGANANISDCDFINCSAPNWAGGAIYLSGANAVISDCSFNNCSAKIDSGGAIYLSGANASVENSNFTNCMANYGGGIWISGANASVKNSNFNNVNATTQGAGIYWNSGANGTVNNCTFTNVVANNGGGIYWNSGANESVVNCNFTNVNATSGGGSAIKFNNNANSSVINCTVTGAHSNNVGGAIHWIGANAHAENCTFTNVSGGNKGGVIYFATANASAINCNFTNTNSTMGGGALYVNGATSVVDNCTFTNISSTNNGGAIYWNGANGNLTNSTFNNINISGYYTGGAIYWYGANGRVDDCFFTNTAGYCGGAIGWAAANGNISNCTFTKTNGTYGGGIYGYGSGCTIKDCTFISTNASTYGGGIYWTTYALNLSSSNFTNTSAINTAGAVYSVGASSSIRDCNFNNSTASQSNGYAGAVYCGGTSSVVSDCNFNNCSAYAGGSIQVGGSSSVVKDCEFTNGYAAAAAGAIYWSSNNGKVTGSTFTNMTGASGGVIYWSGTNGVVDDCEFTNGYSRLGGAIYWRGTNGLVNNSDFIDCYLADGGKGSAIYIRTNASLAVNDSSCTPKSGDESAPIYNDGTLLSDVVVTTINGEEMYVIYGQNINLNANVSTSGIPVAGGVVTLKVNATDLNGSYVEINATSDVNGLYSASEFYTPDFIGSEPVNGSYLNTTANQVINQGILVCDSALIGINVSAEGIYGENATGSINTTENGAVRFIIDGVDFFGHVENGTFVILNTDELPGGDYTDIPVYFLSDNMHYVGIAVINFTIAPNNATMTFDVENITYGDDEVITVTVKGLDGKAVPTGDVIFYFGEDKITVPLDENGTASYTFSGLGVGNYAGNIRFTGDNNYYQIFDEFEFNVRQLQTTVTVDPVKGNAGEKVTITARVTDENGNPVQEGNVTIELNGKSYKADVVNGIATFEVVLPEAGNYSATAYYEGFNYENSSVVFTVEVSDVPGPNPNPNPNPNPTPIGNMENTGNPLLVLLIALCAIGLESFRRKF